MIKAVVFFVLGCAATYLYFNPGDFDGMLDAGKTALHQSAVTVQELTK